MYVKSFILMLLIDRYNKLIKAAEVAECDVKSLILMLLIDIYNKLIKAAEVV